MSPVRGLLTLGLLALPVTALVFCQQLGGGPARPRDGAWNRPLAERSADPFPRRFVNGAGESVEIAAPPRRIVSATVVSDAVLLEICPPERIHALHALSKDPRYSPVAEASAAFPRHLGGEAEEILAAEPDLVVVSSFSRKEMRNLLSRDGCAVLRFLGFASVEDIQNNIRALGYAIGADAAAERLVEQMDVRLAAVESDREARRPWRLLHYAGGYTSGSDTTFDSLLQRVGAQNVARELGISGSRAIQPEEVLIRDPDALVIGVEPGGEDRVAERLGQMPGFAHLEALRRGRLVLVPNAWLLSTSHHVAHAAETIAATLDRWGTP